MIAVARDITILIGICLAVWLLTQARYHVRQLERNRGELVYTVDVNTDAALRLINALEDHGFLNGIPKTYWIGNTKNIYELRVVTHPAVMANPEVQEVLRVKFDEVCHAAFAGEQAMVKLANRELQTFQLLVEPQVF